MKSKQLIALLSTVFIAGTAYKFANNSSKDIDNGANEKFTTNTKQETNLLSEEESKEITASEKEDKVLANNDDNKDKGSTNNNTGSSTLNTDKKEPNNEARPESGNNTQGNSNKLDKDEVIIESDNNESKPEREEDTINPDSNDSNSGKEEDIINPDSNENKPGLGENNNKPGEDSNNNPSINQNKINNVIALINGISSDITFDDEKLLENIQKEYSLLNEKEQKLVTNYNELVDAQVKMENIKEEIHRVYNLINAIPENITIYNIDEAEKAVSEAEKAYGMLPEESKKGIPATTRSIMEFSREQITRIKDSIANANNPKVLAMQEQIAKLPELKDEYISDYKKVEEADILIEKALNDYNSLPQELQNAVNNKEKLAQAYEKITYLKAKIIEKEIAKIDLSKVTENDRPKLEALDSAYKNLNKVGQLLVTNYQDLRGAIVKLDDELANKPVVDQGKVDNVVALISGINDVVTFDDEEVIENVQKEYDLLNVAEKKLVTNYSQLESAQSQMKNIKEEIDRVYNLINHIPENITIYNIDEAEKAVSEAEKAYNMLPEESKKGIPSTTRSIMEFSRDTITRLRDSIANANDPKVLAMQEQIASLPELKDEDISNYTKVEEADILIEKALSNYNSLPQELQNAVNNQEKLGQACEKITYLKAKIIEKEIAKVDLSKVTEADRATLEALDAAYKNLNRVGQLLVTNYQDLRGAIVRLDDELANKPVVNGEKVENVIALINEIDDVITFDHEKALENVQKEYDLLNIAEKELVTNYSQLETAQLQMRDIKKEINRVYNLINSIPEDITIDNLEDADKAVREAEEAYNLLPEESRKGIPSTTRSIMEFSRDHITRLRNSIANANAPEVLALQEKIANLPELKDEDMLDYEKVKAADALIENALMEYNNLPQELQNAVNNEEKLTEAYKNITYLKAKIIEKEIAAVDLSKVTEADRPKLEALDAAYNNLNRIGQLLVSNHFDLRTAITKLNMDK